MVTGLFSACKGGEDNSIPRSNTVYQGGKTHTTSVKETDNYIAINGQTDYTIVVPANTSNTTLLAVEELNLFMEKSAGVTFKTILDIGVTVDENSKYIVIGNTTVTKEAGITLDYNTYGNDGYIVKTIGKTVFLGGYSGNGDVFAVYEFLKHTINYQYFTLLTMNYDVNPIVKLYDFDIVEIPDFAQRIVGTTGWASGYYAETTVKRNRNDLTDEAFLHPSQLNGYGHFHNTQYWLPASSYADAHPEWYSSDRNEFCYTAHGDEEEYNAMQDELIQRIVLACKRWPSTTNVNITHNDYGYKCSCETCREELAKCNQSYSGMIIKFMNDLEEKLNAYMATNNDGLPRDRTFTIQFFAYSFTIVPPVEYETEQKMVDGQTEIVYVQPKKDSNGNYILLGEEYKCNPNVHVWFAPLSAQFVDALDHETNAQQYEQYRAWLTVADTVDFWVYGANFQNNLAPYIGINGFVENVRLFAKDGNDGLILFEQEHSAVGIGFFKLQGYIASNIAWNINYDVPTLMDNYFDGVFGPASKIMREYYDDFTAYFYAMMESGVMGKDVYAISQNASIKNIFTQSVCEKWENYTKLAMAEIEPLKATDPERYNIYYEEIITESIMPRYFLIKFYESEYSPAQVNQMKKTLIADMDRTCSYVSEGYNRWESYISSWRNDIY